MFLSPWGRGQVRGGNQHLLDLLPDAFRILHDGVRPEPHDAPAFTFHGRCTPGIGLGLKGMVVTVYFNDELS